MSSSKILSYDVIMPRQGAGPQVFTFAARASDIARIARIERAGRDERGTLQGFQRPQIASHIREIRDYLEKPNAILPNAIIVAFTGSATLAPLLALGTSSEGHLGRLSIDISSGPPGWIVDGQQRFTALSEMSGRDFEVLVSGFICADVEELQRQFILINNTRPLPKALVYELLPQVGDLPHRMSNRSQAALLTEALNFREGSSLRGYIRQQTNPKGVVRDTVLQRVIMNSITDGALRLYADDDALLLDRGFAVISEFFHAVQDVFSDAWKEKTPKTSRLVHGAGIQAMGYVMESLHADTGAEDRGSFKRGLLRLRGKTAWTSGDWTFGKERRRWNSLQNVPADVRQLSLYLVQALKQPHSAEVEAA
ncbi:DGQHR domain-containing protein [Leptolyngbya sp. 15MV]|nr:DGQHR domain-containing protein [Leptolyngbya sp. 15MV]